MKVRTLPAVILRSVRLNSSSIKKHLFSFLLFSFFVDPFRIRAFWTEHTEKDNTTWVRHYATGNTWATYEFRYTLALEFKWIYLINNMERLWKLLLFVFIILTNKGFLKILSPYFVKLVLNIISPNFWDQAGVLYWLWYFWLLSSSLLLLVEIQRFGCCIL